MEIGNVCFGNSRGKYQVSRGRWQAYFSEQLCEPLEEKDLFYTRGTMGEDGFENDVFEIQPYWWGECNCGYEQTLYDELKEWAENNKWHREDCYQTELRNLKIERGVTVHGDYFHDDINAIRSDKDWEEKRKIEKEIYEELTAKHDLPYEGCAVHCTCDYKDRKEQFYEEFIEEHGEHPETCYTMRPNFHHKPTGYKLQWYKYPLRGSYANQDLDFDEFTDIVDDCRASIE
jgi:hypothetical protein